MIAYTGHADYRFCYVSNERGAAKGYLIGILPTGTHEVVRPPLGYSDCYGVQTAVALGLQAVEVDGLSIDGDGVFHGRPARRVVDLDCEGVFHRNGDYNDRRDRRSKITENHYELAYHIARVLFDPLTVAMNYSMAWKENKIAEILADA